MREPAGGRHPKRNRNGVWGQVRQASLLAFVLCSSCFPRFVEWRSSRFIGVPRADLFDAPEPAPAVEVAGREEDVLDLVMPADTTHPGSRDPLKMHLYMSKSGPVRGSLLVLPTLGGRYTLSTLLAEHYSERGWEVLRLERRGPLVPKEGGITGARDALRGAVIDARRALAWLDRHDLHGSTPVGVVGVSAGAIVAALVAGLDERVSAAAFVLGGGNLAEMAMSASGTGLARLRRIAAKRRPGMRERFPGLLGELLDPVDPLLYAGRLAPERVLMINGVLDRVVPRRCYMALWEAWGRPPLYELPTGHFVSVVFLPLALDLIERHFERWLAPRGPSAGLPSR